MPDSQLDQAWVQAYAAAEEQFLKLVKVKRFFRDASEFNLRRPCTAEDIKKRLNPESLKLATEEDRARHSKWTSAVKTVLKPIEMLGGMIATTVATAMPGVGAPAGLACNALMYLIQTGHTVSNNYDRLALLFEQIGQFTKRFNHYDQPRIDADLTSILHQVMISYIIICGLAIRLTRKPLVGKYAEAFFFGEDTRIKGQLDKLDRLTKFETSMVVTLTYVQVQQISTQVEALFDDWPEFREEFQQFKDQAEVIGDKVGDVWALEKKKEGNTKYQEQLKKMKEVLNPKTEAMIRGIMNDLEINQISEAGRWLRHHELVVAWLSKDTPILHIHGNPKSGKSHLVNGLHRHLLEKYPQGDDRLTGVSVACHFWRNNQIPLRSLGEALRGLAYTIAQNDRKFASYFYENCFTTEINEPPDLWKKLFLGFYRETDYENRAFLIFDGLDQADPQGREALLGLLKDIKDPDKKKKSRLRVLLVESPLIGRTVDELVGHHVPAIHITKELNEPDVRMYVRKMVDKEKVCSWAPELWPDIIDSITENAKGNFSLVDYSIEFLKDKNREEDIREALTRSPKTLPEAIYKDLMDLGDTLSGKEVKELIEILTWVICGRERFSLGQMASLLDKDGQGGPSLMYLERQLRTRYQTLLTVVRADRKTTEDLEGLRTNFFSASQQTEAPSNESKAAESGVSGQPGLPQSPTQTNPPSAGVGPVHPAAVWSDPQTTVIELESDEIEAFFRSQIESVVSKTPYEVLETEVNIVRNVLNLVCGPELFGRFGFEEFFKQKLRRQTLVINLDPKAGDAKLLKKCLMVIADGTALNSYQLKSAESLLKYAQTWCPEHLLDVDRESVKDKDKKEIGALIVRIFREPGSTKRLVKDNEYFKSDWLRTDYKLERVQGWMTDPEVMKGLDDEDREWINGKVSKNIHYILLPAMATVAKCWLQEYEWSEDMAYEPLEAFIDIHPDIAYPERDVQNQDGETPDRPDGAHSTGSAEAQSDRIDEEIKVNGTAESKTDNTNSPDSKSVEGELANSLVKDEHSPTKDEGENSAEDAGSEGNEVSWSAARVLKVAKWAGFEEDSIWHARVASTILLEDSDAVDLATEHFKTALKKDETNWYARIGLARLYADQYRWDAVLETLVPRSAEEYETDWWSIQRQVEEKKYGDYLILLGKCHAALEHHEKAAEAFRQALELRPEDLTMVTLLFQALSSQEKYADIIEELKKMDTQDSSAGNKANRQAGCLQHCDEEGKLHKLLFVAARMCNELDFLRQAMVKALADADTRDLDDDVQVLLRLWLGTFLLEEVGDIDEAEKVLDKVMDLARSIGYGYLIDVIAPPLSRIYIDRAKAARLGSAVTKEYIDKLTNIAPPSWQAFRDVSLVLGYWYSKVDINQESARAHLVKYVRLGVNLLSDDDLDNDREAYENLGRAFTASGDDDNALAAWSLINNLTNGKDTPPQDATTATATTSVTVTVTVTVTTTVTPRSNADAAASTDGSNSQSIGVHESGVPDAVDAATSEIAEAHPVVTSQTQKSSADAGAVSGQTPSSDDTPWYCDGMCGTQWTHLRDLYICRVCIDVQLDARCKAKIEAGALRPRICSKDHEWLYVPRVDRAAAAAVPRDHVRVGLEIISVEEWKERIRAEWKLESFEDDSSSSSVD